MDMLISSAVIGKLSSAVKLTFHKQAVIESLLSKLSYISLKVNMLSEPTAFYFKSKKSFTSTKVKLKKPSSNVPESVRPLPNPYVTLIRWFETSPKLHLSFIWTSPELHLKFTRTSPDHLIIILPPDPSLTHCRPYLRVISEGWGLTMVVWDAWQLLLKYKSGWLAEPTGCSPDSFVKIWLFSFWVTF